MLLLLAGAGAALWAFSRWRAGVRAVLLLVVFEGALRKWAFPGAQELIYLAKDILLLAVYLGYWSDRSRLRIKAGVPGPLTAALAAATAVGTLQVFNPNLPNPLVGMLGLKAYFLYVPLLWVLPAAFSSDEELASELRLYSLLSLPVAMLAVLQFFSSPDSPINAYARGEGGIIGFGSSAHVRVTGTFSYISGYSSYLLLIVILVLANLAATRWRFRGNQLTYLTLAFALLGLFMTGSRGPVFTLALLFPLYWWLGVARESRRDLVTGRLLLALALVGALVNYVGADAMEAFYGRATEASDTADRFLSPFVSPFYALDDAGLLGFGIGATHQTAEAVTRGLEPYSWLGGALIEDEPGRVMLELGPLGFGLFYIARVGLILVSLRQVFRLRLSLHRAIATSGVLFFLAQLPGAIVFNVTSGLYYWSLGGLVFLVVRLDREALAPAQPLARFDVRSLAERTAARAAAGSVQP